MPYLPMSQDIEVDSGVDMDVPAEENRTESVSVIVKNRRKRYLDTHPGYFSAELELAGPLALILSH